MKFLDSKGLEYFYNKLKTIFVTIDAKASQAEAEAGTDDTKMMTSLRTKQSILKNTPKGVKNLSISGKTITVTFDDNTNTTLTTQDTTYNVATQSANGLMAATDKKKLDSLQSGTNAVKTVNGTMNVAVKAWTTTATSDAIPIPSGYSRSQCAIVAWLSKGYAISAAQVNQSTGQVTFKFVEEVTSTSNITMQYVCIAVK